jgi:hypothetical protein
LSVLWRRAEVGSHSPRFTFSFSIYMFSEDGQWLLRILMSYISE